MLGSAGGCAPYAQRIRQKHFAETLDNLRAKEEALELRLKFLESQVV